MSQTAASHSGRADDDAAGMRTHVVSPFVLIGVFLALVMLTIATVGVTELPLVEWLGPQGAARWGLALALAIAVIKATLVGLFFMHLIYDKPFNGVVLFASLAFVGLFIFFALMDTAAYQSATIPGHAPMIAQ